MKVAVLGGAGAMGSAIGAAMHRQNHDVTLVDVNQSAVDLIQSRGLVIEQKDGTQSTYAMTATTSPVAVGTVDLIVVFVKCYHTASAIEGAKPMIGPSTKILSLQNGWGNGPKITSLVDPENVLVGVTYHSASVIEPGRVLHAGVGPTFLGTLDGQVRPEAQALAAELNAEDFPVSAESNVLVEIWKKLCLNICTLPTSSLLGFGASQLVEHDSAKNVMASLLKEAVAVANAKGIAIDYNERWETITGLLGRVGRSKSSMLQDVEAKRQTEIDVINGAIVATGRETGIATPVNGALTSLIKALQESYR